MHVVTTCKHAQQEREDGVFGAACGLIQEQIPLLYCVDTSSHHNVSSGKQFRVAQSFAKVNADSMVPCIFAT